MVGVGNWLVAAMSSKVPNMEGVSSRIESLLQDFGGDFHLRDTSVILTTCGVYFTLAPASLLLLIVPHCTITSIHN